MKQLLERVPRAQVEAFVDYRGVLVEGKPKDEQKVRAIIGTDDWFPYAWYWNDCFCIEDECPARMAMGECSRRHSCANGSYLSRLSVKRYEPPELKR